MSRLSAVYLVSLFIFCASLLLAQSGGGKPDPQKIARRGAELRQEKLPPEWEKMKPLFIPKKAAVAGEWLATQPEPGQGLAQFQASWRQQVRDRSVGFVDVVLIGDFTPSQKTALAAACRHIEACFGVKTRQAASLPDHEVKDAGRRKNPYQGQLQYHTDWLHTQLLKPRLKKDSICLLGFTATDLFPKPEWNFVFGIAYPADRIGLWSIARNGKADGTPEESRVFLRRTISTATHETGHLFGMAHCLAYECLMNGANHRAESDSKALVFCPCCSAKMDWLWKLKAAESLQAQLKICQEIGLAEESAILQAELKLLNQ
ncbi:MAG: hypothetical protein RL095_3284 [Verrucomicrobiota bacterium]|jgi:archaemetzincin